MQAKTSQNKWKQKAIDRRKEIARLKKRHAEVVASRAYWKQKYKSTQISHKQLSQQKARGHQYPIVLVWLCLYIYNRCHCSLRTCSEIVAGSALLLQINCRRPQAASIRNWVIKYGYHCYHQRDAYSGEWALIIDESVSIGQEKLLLVLGLPVDEWKFDRPLSHQDVRVLHLSMASSWKAEAIERVLRQVAQQVKVAYCVSDQGNNLKAALRTLKWSHLYDCAHQWAHLMKQCYEKAPDFTDLLKQTARLRKAWALSEHCHLIPPSMRSKARFLNLFPLVNWMEKIRAHWDALSVKAQQGLAFLQAHHGLIDELICLKEVIGQMAALLKVKGMSLASLQACYQLLEPCQQGRPLAFKTKLLTAWQGYHPLLSEKSLLCSSDIIESYFGRYKLRLQANGMQTLTESVLMMGGWSHHLTQENVEKALSQVSMKDIEDWKKENIVPSLLKKRKAFFTKKCPKKAPAV